MNYKNLVNKEIISIFDGKVCGKVQYGLINNFGKLTALVATNETTYVLKIKDIFSYSYDKIMIKNVAKLAISQTENKNLFLNKQAFSILGKNYGNVLDIVFDNNFVIEKIVAENKEFSFHDIVTNNEIIVVNEDNFKRKHFHFAPKSKVNKTTNANQKVVVATKIPIKVVSRNFLLGKKLFKDFVSKDGIMLARKNGVVTMGLLNAAKDHGSIEILANCVL